MLNAFSDPLSWHNMQVPSISDLVYHNGRALASSDQHSKVKHPNCCNICIKYSRVS